jgi:heme exporter protein C
MTMRTKVERGLALSAAAAAVATLVLGLIVAPPDAVQGEAMRLMYVHVPAAWAAYLSFAVVLVSSVGYLVTRRLEWDRRARVAAELGVGLTALAIVLGSIWGRPIWGVWWTWEPRLVTTMVLLLVFFGYLGVRSLGAEPAATARRCAVVGIVGFVDVPIVHMSVVWWRTLHQPPTVLRPEGPAAIEPAMLAALLAGMAAFTLGAAFLYLRRIRLLAGDVVDAAPETATEIETPASVPSLTVVAARGA